LDRTSHLSADLIGAGVHEPWKLPSLPLSARGYPLPLVDHAAERLEALARYGRLQSGS
jgi:deoxyribodipyrimidine photo-lyase